MKPRPSATVTVAAIVGICFAAFTILCCGFAIVSLSTLQLPSAATAPPFVKSVYLFRFLQARQTLRLIQAWCARLECSLTASRC